MTAPEILTSRHYAGQGDYWPGAGGGVRDAQRYGVLVTQGYANTSNGASYVVEYLVVDLAHEATVVDRYRARGRPDDPRVRRRRYEACSRADDLNFLDREFSRLQAEAEGEAYD